VRGLPDQLVFPVATMSADSPDLAAAKRLLDAATKNQGFRFQRIAPGPDGPLGGSARPSSFSMSCISAGSGSPTRAPPSGAAAARCWCPADCRSPPGVEGDALTVLHTVVTDWECS
jgi:hypothetical protein